MTDARTCLACGKPLTRRTTPSGTRYTESARNWEVRTSCNVQCANRTRRILKGCRIDGCQEPHDSRGYCTRHLAARKVIREWPPLTWSPPVQVPCQAAPDLFLPPSTRGNWDHRPAVKVCQGCPVRVDCLTWAMTDEKPPSGVWGGEQFVDGVPVRARVIA